MNTIHVTGHDRGRRAAKLRARNSRLSQGSPHGHELPIDRADVSTGPELLAPAVGLMCTYEQGQLGIHPSAGFCCNCLTLVSGFQPQSLGGLGLPNAVADRLLEQMTLRFSTPECEKVQFPPCPRQPQHRKPPEEPKLQDKRTFACPYYKWDPKKHQDCRRYKLSRFRDMVHHIRRIHVIALDCTRCHAVFDTLSSLEAHARGVRLCPERPRRGVVSRTDLDTFLEMREWDCRKGKSTDARWKDLWEFLFPGAEAPASIYLGTHEEEITSHLYSFWASHSHDITAGVMEDSGVSVERQSEIWVQELFDTFLKHLLGQFKNSEGNSQIKSFGVTSEITPLPSASPFDNVQSTDWHSSVPSEPAIGETILDGEQLESNQLSFTEPNFDFNNVFAGLNYESSLFTTTAWSDSSPFGPLPALDMSSLVDDAFHFGDDPPAMEQRKQPEVIDLRESD